MNRVPASRGTDRTPQWTQGSPALSMGPYSRTCSACHASRSSEVIGR